MLRPRSEQDFDRFINGFYLLYGLQNQDYNARFGQVVGRDPVVNSQCRLHFRLNCIDLPTSRTIRVKPGNLVPYFNPNCSLSSSEIQSFMMNAVREMEAEGVSLSDRPDVGARLKLASGPIDGISLECQDVMGMLSDAEKQKPLVVQLNNFRFPCKGDTRVCFERFGRGVPDDGKLDPTIFLPRNFQITKRFKEWLLSGLCERCQFGIFEGVQIFEQGCVL